MKRHNNSSKFINTCQNNLVKMAPLVTSQVSSSAESINTILNDFQNEIAFIPEYQRDSDQWSNEKKSLFIDSILNNITVPSFIYSSNNIDNQSFWMKSYEVVDGQQRITLLNDFKNNNFKLLSSCNVSYISENSIYYENRTYDELPKTFQNVFDNYKVSIIYLPETMTEAAKLETFRRLNQQPDTLSSQDIRLSQYAYKHITKYIRLVGVYDTTKEGSIRIIDYASSEGMHWPWANCEKSVQNAWYEWWEGRKTVKGQAPSEMFLWYIIGLYYKELNEIIYNKDHLMNNLHMTFLDSIENVADIAIAHLSFEEDKENKKLCSIEELKNEQFYNFSKWFEFFKNNYPSARGFNVQKHRLIAFMFAALSKFNTEILQDYHINLIDKFLFKPREMSDELGISYPETKGKWNSKKGLYNQIDSVHKIINKILE